MQTAPQLGTWHQSSRRAINLPAVRQTDPGVLWGPCPQRGRLHLFYIDATVGDSPLNLGSPRAMLSRSRATRSRSRATRSDFWSTRSGSRATRFHSRGLVWGGVWLHFAQEGAGFGSKRPVITESTRPWPNRHQRNAPGPQVSPPLWAAMLVPTRQPHGTRPKPPAPSSSSASSASSAFNQSAPIDHSCARITPNNHPSARFPSPSLRFFSSPPLAPLFRTLALSHFAPLALPPPPPPYLDGS